MVQTQQKKRILMLAAENAAIAGAKVGGMADVIRDLPLALAEHNVIVDVAMPCYGFLTQAVDTVWLGELSVNFAGREEQVTVSKAAHPNLKEGYCYLFSHPLFNAAGQIYSQDEAARPFASDASKFALFNLAVASALSTEYSEPSSTELSPESIPVIAPAPDIVHLHDWHCGFFAILRAFEPSFAALRTKPCVLTIHNLAMQGIRPLKDDASSLSGWFPVLAAQLDKAQLGAITDPRYDNCVNPLRAAIVLADKVHLVSPTYATEVLKPSAAERGFIGGEGLEADLQHKLQQRQLLGILNGCMYQTDVDAKASSSAAVAEKLTFSGWQSLLQQAESSLLSWQRGQAQISSQHFVAFARLQQWQRHITAAALNSDALECDDFLLTSVGRLTNQKLMILRYRFAEDIDDLSYRGKTVLQLLLERLKSVKPKGKFILLGSGDIQLAREFADVATCYDNFVFLDGFDETLSVSLYQSGSLFLMPSSFEPCGISQMLAMREGQLCLVNHVGGLKDTVQHMESGFAFEGESLQQQGCALLETFAAAIALHGTDKWRTMQLLAKQQRFDWHRQAGQYVDKLYSR